MSVQVRSVYRRLVFLTWFFTLDLIMFGAFVRLTDSGLGCPDWPGCYGKITPFGASGHIADAVLQQPYGPVSMSKAWIEMIHRYWGSLLGLLIIAITYMAWKYRKQLGRSAGLATFCLVAVCLQGAFGAWTVTHKLMPVIVTAHLLGGMLLLGLMSWLAAREKNHAAIPAGVSFAKPWMAAGLVILFIQIVLGGWVSTNYAALACMDFPTCHGQWLPAMDFSGGYSVLRGLGELSNGEIISQEALTAIHWVHRNFAVFVFVYLFAIALRLRKEQGLRAPAQWLILLLLAQVLTGLTTIFFQWPLLIAVLHNGGAAGLVIAAVTLLVRLSRAGTDYKVLP
ncbi:MAG: heme A synthase [Alcaligenaceae bacterium]|nr:heme A synthase [Alcaligenaceae bacterium]